MNLKLFSVIGVLSSFSFLSAQAEESPPIGEAAVPEKRIRTRSVTAAFDRSPGDLNSYLLSGNIPVAEMPRLLGDYKVDDVPLANGKNFTAKSGTLGMGFDFSRQFMASVRGDYLSLPNSVFARGAEIEGRYRLNSCSVGLQLKGLHYSSDRATKGKKLRETGIAEKSARLDLSYHLTPDWTIHASETAYRYNGATPSELSEILASRPNISAGLLDSVEGFPSRSGNIGVGYQISEAWDTELSFTKTSYELVPVSSSVALNVNYTAGDHWEFGATGTRLRQDGQKSGSVLGLQTTYLW